jgi:competence protein ComEC
VQLSVKEGGIDFISGDRVRFSSRIRKPRNYGLPGEFDIERHMAFRGISATVFVNSSDDIILLGDSGQYRIQRQVDLIAHHLGEFISESISPQEAAILRALLLGDMGAVPKTIKEAYTRAGVNHILSISGFHVGILAFITGKKVGIFDALFQYTENGPVFDHPGPFLLSFALRRGAGYSPFRYYDRHIHPRNVS